MPRSILVLFAHPAIHRSRVQRALADAARGVPGVTLHDLYAAYPNHDIDAAAEQALLARHDVVVFQHPFYWYSTPAILKDWQDHVLSWGWAYGPGGRALVGKTFLCALSTGGSADAYTRDGSTGRTVRELLAPIDQTARLCGMTRLPPFVVHGANALQRPAISAAAADWAAVLDALREDRVDARRVADWPRINADLPSLLGRT